MPCPWILQLHTGQREKSVTRTVPLFRKPAKKTLHGKGVRVKKVKRMKKAKTPEKDKTEYSLQEWNFASCMNLKHRDNDHFLYCGECNKEFKEEFPVHGFYNYIQDKEVSAGDPLKADHTLPECLEIKRSKIIGAGLGVFSKVGQESRIMFGPYGGDIITDNPNSGYCWQIYKVGKPSRFVDAQNKATSNWIKYVNCAMKEADKNLLAFQYKGGIYYCTLKPVSSGEELLVWYGDEFVRELGLIRDDIFCSYSSKNSGHTSMRIHTGERQLKCEVCEYACYYHSDFKRHMRKHTGERPYKCKVCGYAFKTIGNLTDHMRIHTKERSFMCEVCGYACNEIGNLTRHMRIHTEERPFKCEVCGEAFKQSGHLRDHMRRHTGEKPFKCEVCGSAFNESGCLKKHMRIHTGERPYKCEVCDEAFKQSGHLRDHMRIHTEERPFKCEACGEAFKHGGHLIDHMKINTGERPHKCEVCGYACNNSGTLKTHMRTHTGERPYKCEVCGYGCNRNGDLKTHMRIHTGERPYKCE
ncbi:hypothetical protein DPMN_021334, partial [Dreissena polymorpha]